MRFLEVPAPPVFSFRRTVLSHGWCALPPFHFDRRTFDLGRVLRLETGRVLPVVIRGNPASATVRVLWDSASLARPERREIAGAVRRMLRLEEDLSPFYDRALGRGGFEWIPRTGAGRLLRSPTVFEDLVKLICTTNCTWALTEVMVGNLVGLLGEEAAGARPRASRLRTVDSDAGVAWQRGEEARPFRSFPTPEAMAKEGTRFFEREVRAGYRAAALAELAERVAGGTLDPESWDGSDRPTAELRSEILEVRGAGPYTAENLLRLLGRYEGLALDSWCRAKFARLYGRSPSRRRPARAKRRRDGGRRAAASTAATDAAIERKYRWFGPWRGLALWCDLTRDWIEDEEPHGGEGDKF